MKNKLLAGDILDFYSGHCMVIGYNSRHTYFNSLASPDISPDCMSLVLKKIDIRSDVMILYVEDSGEE